MGIWDSVGHAMMDNDRLHFAPAPCADAAQRWLVTLSAPLSAFNGDYVDAVETGKDNAGIADGLARLWNVRDRASFEETAHWLVEQGHRGGYGQVWQGMLSIDDIRRNTPGMMRAVLSMTFPGYYYMKASRRMDYEGVMQASGKSAQELNLVMAGSADLLDDLRNDLATPPETITSLVGWDAVRLAALSRWAVQLGYIRPEEFARFAGGLTQQVRQAYADWRQLSAAYVAGGFIWNPSEARRENLTRTNRMLLKEAKSPYRQVAWR